MIITVFLILFFQGKSMDSVNNSQEYAKELTRIYNRFNKHFWNKELPEVIITFVPTLKSSGHITTKKVWIQEDDKEAKYELNISAYEIDRTREEICATLLHEQCHLYNMLHGIEDTSNHKLYHNKAFKKTAEDHGLDVEYVNSSKGWSDTKLDEKTCAYVKKLNIKTFSYKREYVYKGSNLKRYACPVCKEKGPVVYSVTAQNVLCGFCKSNLIYSPTKKSRQKGLSGYRPSTDEKPQRN
jgi:hypothetical protein